MKECGRLVVEDNWIEVQWEGTVVPIILTSFPSVPEFSPAVC